MTRVIARIQGHPLRADMHARLVESLAPLPTEVSLHSSTPPNPWLGYRQALSDLPDCSHVVLLQDDAEVCANFAPAVEQIAEAHPDTPVCLFLAYLPRATASEATKAMRLNKRYAAVNFRDFVPVIAILWPKHKAQEMLDWTQDNPKLPGNPAPRSDDSVIGFWMRRTKQTVLVSVPSLVQHPDTVPSLIGKRAAWGRDRGRVALFLAEDGLHYDWK
jgi:hypothetical protein